MAIQSLILTSEPYFNEPGYQGMKGSANGDYQSERYNEGIRNATLEWAILDQLKNPTPCFRDVSSLLPYIYS